MAHIVTGVDRLVALINDKGKVTVGHAARELGVSKGVIEEWAEFLQDEGYITIEYSFNSKTLTKRQLSQEEIKTKHSDLHNRQSALINQAETMQMQMDREKDSFKALLKEFQDIQKQVDKDYPAVEKKLKSMKRLDKIQQDIDKTVDESLEDYRKEFLKTDDKLALAEQRYNGIIHKVDQLLVALDQRKKDLVTFEGLDTEIRQHEEYVTKIIDIAKRTLKENHDIQPDKDEVGALEEQAIGLRQDFQTAVNDYLEQISRAERHYHLVQEQFENKRQLLTEQEQNISNQSTRLQQYYTSFLAQMRAKREELLALDAYLQAHTMMPANPGDTATILVQAAKILVERGYPEYGKTIYRLIREDIVQQRINQTESPGLVKELLSLYEILKPRSSTTS